MFVETQPLHTIFRAVALSGVGVTWVIFVVRIIGLRAFSKMTAFDFVITVAIGSLLAGAGQATSWAAFFQSTVAMATLLGVQYVVAVMRQRSESFAAFVQNEPVLLMEDGIILQAALQTTRVAEDDLIAKLREANVLDLGQVQAVVLETTGNISVLHGADLQDRLLQGVKRL